MGNIEAHEKLSVFQRITYGMGNLGGNFINLTFSMWVFKRYCPPEGEGATLIPILWLSYALMAGRVVDAIADPLIGFWSDRTRTRWGRRIPFMAVGGLPLCVIFMLIWTPPISIFPANSIPLFVYLCAIMGALWFLFTVVLCPYLALMPEVAVSSEDRVNLSVYQSVFLMVSSGVAMIGAPFIVESYGFVTMGIIFGGLALIGLYAPVFTVKEKYTPKNRNDDYGIFTALKWSFSNKPFLVYISSNIFCQIGLNAIIMSMAYIVTILLGKPDSYVGIIMAGTGVVSVISFFAMNSLSGKIDKAKIYRTGILTMAILLPSLWVFGRFDVSLNLAFLGIDYVVSELVIAFAVITLTGFPVAALMLLPSPILSDIIDIDELKTGERREAMYFGAQGLLQKAGVGLSGAMMGALFNKFGYSPDNHLGLDLLGPVAGGLVLIGYIIFLWYPLNDKKMNRVRAEIKNIKIVGENRSEELLKSVTE